MGTDAEIKRRVQELLDDRRPEPRALQPLPARVLGRPAPAHRRRPRARGQPEADRLRRAGLGARRVGAGADPQPAQGPAARVRPHLRLHRPRPQRRAAHLGPRDGHVPRPGRRDRDGHGPLHRAEAPLHAARCSRPCRSPIRTIARSRVRIVLEGDVPNPINPPRRATSTRAARAFTRASATSRAAAAVEGTDGPTHRAACHYPLERWPMTAEEMRLETSAPSVRVPVSSPAAPSAPAAPTAP